MAPHECVDADCSIKNPKSQPAWVQDADDYSKDYVERDERRLGDLGRRTVEMFALAHIFGELEAAYCEAESIKRQDALIREEEEAGQLEGARTAARVAADRGKKARKKVSLQPGLLGYS